MLKLNRFTTSDWLYILMLTIAASLIGLGLYGIDDLKIMNNQTRSLYADRIVCLKQLSNIRYEYGAEIPRITQSVKNGTLTFGEAVTQLRDAEKIININWSDYKLTYQTAEENRLVKKTDILKTLADKADYNLESVLVKEDAPALNELVKKGVSENLAVVVQKVTQLMDLQVSVASEVSKNNEKLYQQASQKFILLIFISLFIALSLSFFIVRNIKQLINEILKSSDIIKESEQKYRSLLEHASDAIYLTDADNNFIEVNESMCEMTGYSREELFRLKVEGLEDPEQLETDPVLRWEQLPYEALIKEHRFVRKNGNVFDVEINIKKFVDNKVLVIARDITEKKLTQDIMLKEKTLSDAVINSLPGIFYLRNDTGKLLRWNKNLETVTGFTMHEIEGLVVRDMIASEDFGIMDKAAEKVFNDGYAMAEAKIKIKNGSKIPFLLTGCPIMYEGQLCLLGIGVDISSHVKAQEDLRLSEANLQTILNTTDTAYAVFDLFLNVLAFNQKAVSFVKDQYDRLPQKGDQLEDYFPKERFPEFADYAAAVLTGKNINYEIDYPQHDGSKLWYDVRLFPVTNNHQEILGVMMALYDVTGRKNAEQDLKNAYNRIQRHIKHIKDITWKQSHLIRSPLANLMALVQLLEVDPTDATVLGFIGTELKRLDSIIIEMASDVADQDIDQYDDDY
jgi:PAS domain S-box-containing protein